MMLQKLKAKSAGQRAFDLLGFLEGRTHAFGVFEDRFGREKKRFTVEIEGRRKGSELELEENFEFSDGTTSQRVWTLTQQDAESFTGTCADLVGVAKGALFLGGAAMDYVMNLETGKGRSMRLGFSDVFYAEADGVVLNRAAVNKWGLRVGQVLIVFTKPGKTS